MNPRFDPAPRLTPALKRAIAFLVLGLVVYALTKMPGLPALFCGLGEGAALILLLWSWSLVRPGRQKPDKEERAAAAIWQSWRHSDLAKTLGPAAALSWEQMTTHAIATDNAELAGLVQLCRAEAHAALAATR